MILEIVVERHVRKDSLMEMVYDTENCSRKTCKKRFTYGDGL